MSHSVLPSKTLEPLAEHPAPLEGVGSQIVLDLYDCDTGLLDDVAHVRHSMLEAARIAGATIITDNFHRFEPWGVSGVVIIAESHIAIHCWPEHRYAALDVFTCGPMDMQAACDALIQAFGSERTRQRGFVRGELIHG